MKNILMIILLSFVVSGCTQLGGTYFKKSHVSIADSEGDTVGTLFVWEADTSAAILFRNGSACMQTALAIKTVNMEAKANLSDAILGLSKAAEKLAETPGSEESLASVTGSIQEAAAMLTTTTERTAFLNMGMFYMCQIAANKSLSEKDTNELIKTLVESAAGMKTL